MLSSPASNIERRPFPNGVGDLYNDAWWGVLPAALRSTPWAWRSRKALAKTFSNDFLIEQTFVSHPIGYQSVFRYGRWAMFRLGLALSIVNAAKGTQSRLLAQNLYEACANELDFGLFLGVSCVEIVHEPKALTSGPDYFAKPRATNLAWEVKHPTQSKHFQLREQLASRISTGVSTFVNAAIKAPAWSLELLVQDRRLAEATEDMASERDLLAAFQRSILRWAKRPTPGRFAVAPGLAFVARRTPTASLAVGGPAFVGDTQVEVDRLVNVQLSKAASQLDEGGIPGFIVLAREGSGLAGNYATTLVGSLRNQPKKFESVLGVMLYETEVDERHMLVSRARLYMRSEARSLARELLVLQRGGKLGISFF